MRTQSVPLVFTVPNTVAPTNALSFAITIWHDVPLNVPIANPIAIVLSGSTSDNCALTFVVCAMVATLNDQVAAPLRFKGPLNVSGTDVGVGVGVVVVSEPQDAAAAAATSATSARRPRIDHGIIGSP